MRFNDVIRFSFKAMMSRKRRTFLTLLGIFLGVLTLTAVISFAEGYGLAIKRMFKGSSLRLIYVISRGSVIFDDADIDKIERMDGVEAVFPMIQMPMEITMFGKSEKYTVLGVDPEYVSDVFPDIAIKYGDWPASSNEEAAVLGYRLAERLSDGEPYILLGMNVKAEIPLVGLTVRPRVVGVIEPYGTSIMTDVDNTVIVPLGYALRIYQKIYNKKAYYGLSVIVEDVNLVESVVDQLREEYGIGKEVMIVAMKDMQKQLDQVVNMSVLVLGAIAAMTIVVASIGIMNAMYTAVTERVRIIGVMRAMGASKGDIGLSFLFEAVLMSSVAIILGMLLGYGGALGITSLFFRPEEVGPHRQVFMITPTLSPGYALLIAGSTLLVTILGALPPAMKAAQLEPAKALRFE